LAVSRRSCARISRARTRKDSYTARLAFSSRSNSRSFIEAKPRVDRSLLERGEIVGKRRLVRERALVIDAAPIGNPRNLVGNLLLGFAQLGARFNHARLMRAKLGGEVCLLARSEPKKLAGVSETGRNS
jgi:hypothetical protein